MSLVLVIPARMGSTRFPGKPLAPIAGRTMIERMWRIANAVTGIARTVIATDSLEIQEHVERFGGEALMTPADCRNGTERCMAALRQMGDRPDHVINLQGDAVLTPPAIIQAVVDTLMADGAIAIATPATQLSIEQLRALEESKSKGDVGGTTVTFDKQGNALYFSKRIIPLIRKLSGKPPVWRHIGLYGYRTEVLERYLSLPEGVFEAAEGLEQLRALEHGIPIRVVPVTYGHRTHWSVDAPNDVPIVEDIIEREGELVEDDGTAAPLA